MDTPAILAKITGVCLFLWTARSLFRHVKTVRQKNENSSGDSVSEQFLNNLLLYVWLLFMFIFSTGMVLNN